MLPYIGLDVIKIPKVVVFKSCICLLPAGSWRAWKMRGFLSYSFLCLPCSALLLSFGRLWPSSPPIKCAVHNLESREGQLGDSCSQGAELGSSQMRELIE